MGEKGDGCEDSLGFLELKGIRFYGGVRRGFDCSCEDGVWVVRRNELKGLGVLRE